ncbi:MAG: hypothetical protein WC944_05325 [Candidatus Cloacimonadaceae bacterium]|nr:hypothetical protein [Candidatus Cloacimonadota bacterium]MCK9241993.1 hypothetical protein [Candidatus Cloacimonadota bacterium]
MKAALVLFALICLALFTSCDLDDADSLAQTEIRDILYDLSLDFNLGNIYGMLDHVDNDYLHKGQITWHLNEEILDRMGRFQLLEIEVLYIEIDGNYAVAHTVDHYSSSIESVSYNEPEDSGYFSYFHRKQGSWLIYGNQFWIKSGGI